MTGINLNVGMVGHITIEVRDADSLELKDTITKTNVFTLRGNNLTYGITDDLNINNYRYYPPTPASSYGVIGITSRVMTSSNIAGFFGTSTPLISSNTTVTNNMFDVAQPYVETKQRFNAPGAGNARTINTVVMTNVGANEILAYTPLLTPCIQGDNEVLDVTYRIKFVGQNTTNTVGISKMYDRFVMSSFWFLDNTRAGSRIAPRNIYGLWNSRLPQTGKLLTTSCSSAFQINSTRPTPVYDQGILYKNKHTNALTTTSFNGMIIGSISYGGDPVADYTENNSGSRTIAWAQFTPPSFANKPVQPIHNHNKDAISPFMDVNYLASSQGVINVNGSSWTNPNFPKFYRIQHTNTGSVGASRYCFYKSNTLGFNNELSYNPCTRVRTGWLESSKNSASVIYGYDSLCSVDGVKLSNSTDFHGIYHKGLGLMHEFTDTSMIMWDNNGIVIYDEVYPDRISYYDATTTPALSVTNIGQVATDNNNNIYVACRTNGLFKLSGFPNAITITRMSSSNGLLNVNGGFPQCYGVAEGYSGRIWAAFEGSLSYTDDSGVTWTNITTSTTPSISHPNITPSSWSNIRYILVDRDASTHNIGIVTNTTPASVTTSDLIWYTPSTSTATKYTGRAFDNKYLSVNCSYRGGLWVGNSVRTSYRIKFGDSTTTNELILNSGVTPAYGKPMFYYDYYGSPIVLCGGTASTSPFFYGTSQYDGEYICDSNVMVSYIDSMFVGLIWERSGSGLTLYNRASSGTSNYPTSHRLLFGMSPSVSNINMTLSNKLSPMQEAVWKKNHWNGTNWQTGYYANAVDSSGNNINAIRHNFDTESHSFNGRSMINASAVFQPNIFSNSATLCFKYNRSAKYGTSQTRTSVKNQEYEQTLFELSNVQTNQLFKLIVCDTSNLIKFVSNINDVETITSLGTTPATGIDNRCIITFNGTSVVVYMNSSIIGTITLSQPCDFANTTNTTKFYIGSRAYIWKYQKNSTVPGSFFSGSITNVQLWNVAFDQTDVNNDYTNINGVISSKSASNLKARYQLTESLFGLETKQTSSSSSTLDDGLTISFSNGASGTSFVATDYHTFGVVDGIMKDNATSLTQEFSFYSLPSDTNFTTILTVDGSSNTIPSTTPVVTEYACWGTNAGAMAIPGAVCVYQSGSFGAITAQQITGDGWFETEMCADGVPTYFGFTNGPTNTITTTSMLYAIRYNANRTIDIIQSGAVSQTNVASYAIGDKFRVARVGTSVKFYKVVSGTPQQIGVTSSLASSGTLYGIVQHVGVGNSVVNCKISYTLPAYVMRVGNSTTLTGAYDPYFFMIDTDVVSSLVVNISGYSNPAAILTVSGDTNYWSNMPTPGPNQVVINRRTGHLIFNSSDSGKAVTGNMIVVYSRR